MAEDQQTLRWIPIKTYMHTAESNSVIHKDNTIGREGDNGNFGIDITYLM